MVSVLFLLILQLGRVNPRTAVSRPFRKSGWPSVIIIRSSVALCVTLTCQVVHGGCATVRHRFSVNIMALTIDEQE